MDLTYDQLEIVRSLISLPPRRAVRRGRPRVATPDIETLWYRYQGDLDGR